MALTLDTSRALRTPAELRSLVEAIRAAPPDAAETDSIEWKSDWDLSDAATRFATARHLLGFGNRPVAAAAQTFEGCAYLVAGVEPDNLVGTTPLDPAEIDNQLSRYIAPGRPRWSPTYVTVDGHPILIVTVEAPAYGDRICALQKGYDQARPGRVFIRRHGKTEEANPDDLFALEDRRQATRPSVDLTVIRADDTVVLQPVVAQNAKAWITSERERLAPRPTRARSPFEYSLNGDLRSAGKYAAEVDAYLGRAKMRWLSLQATGSVHARLAPIDLQIVNPTARNFAEVEVVVDLPDDVMAWLSTSDVEETLDPPEPPKPWGTARFGDELLRIRPAALSFDRAYDEIERDGATTRARFRPRHVRPGETVALPTIFLTLFEPPPARTIAVGWRVTSTDTDGWRDGEAVFAVAEQPARVSLDGE